MGLLFMDGFESYSDTEYDAGQSEWTNWNSNWNVGAYGRRSGSGVRWYNVNYADIYKSLPSVVTTLFASCFVKHSSGSAAQWNGITFSYGSSGYQCSIIVTDTGRIKAVSGYWNSATTLGQTDADTVDFTGFHLEIKVVFDDTSGSIEVRLNGNTTPVLNLTSIDTEATADNGCDTVRFNSGTAIFFELDDIVIWDTTGSQINSWMGDMEVVAMLPDADGSTNEWTPSAGNNYECVDEETPSTSDYISVSSADQVDLFSFASVPSPSSATVHALKVLSMAKKDSSGTRKMRHVCYVGSTEYGGADITLTDTYTYHKSIWELNPATSAAWTDAIINGAEFGVESRGT